MSAAAVEAPRGPIGIGPIGMGQIGPMPFNPSEIDLNAPQEKETGNFFFRGIKRLLKKNPGKTLFKTTVTAVEAGSVIKGLTETPSAVAGSLASADKVIKILQVPSVLEMWFTYNYADIGNTRKMKPLLFLRDIASTICAVPQVLDKFGLMSLATLGESLGKVPVIGGLSKLPGTTILGGLEIFVYLVNIAVSLKKLVEIGIGAHATKIEQKIALWKANPDGIEIDPERLARFEKKKEKIRAYQTRYFQELMEERRANIRDEASLKVAVDEATGIINAATITLFAKKARKWKLKREMTYSTAAKEAVNILFYATLIAISILLLCAIGGIALTILAGCLLLFGAYKILDEVVNPQPESIKPAHYFGS